MECTAYAHWNGNPILSLNQTSYLFKTPYGLDISVNPKELMAAVHTSPITNDLNIEAIPDLGIAEIRSLIFHWI